MLFRMALGYTGSEALPDPDDIDIHNAYRGRCEEMYFDPIHCITTRCPHFFGLTTYNYDTLDIHSPCPREYHCAFCGQRFAELPPRYGFLCDLGCLPPLPITIVENIYMTRLWTRLAPGSRPFPSIAHSTYPALP
jgi:hypothetical protein